MKQFLASHILILCVVYGSRSTYVHKYILVERCVHPSFSSNQLAHTTSIIVFQVKSIDNNADSRLSREFLFIILPFFGDPCICTLLTGAKKRKEIGQ
ncbi:hypothetical protein BDV27DRAFT_82053 [Aspergillus caelatus]|uniref:Secreted protein n=1 Tax=Aspergillus caelatus TaxID=61420 RepID=A0A5N6ZJY4_9EURO|nr:uncharacterized protein BDV27DRAFT_82053 [Aspergillus caelatus]KAE8357668.1 hypothetical protein BDV27DRAFT_82053 [Aspergillus caelatus]